MATARQIISEEERYELLSDLYLTLWKQLDLICRDAKWLEIRASDQNELQKKAEAVLKQIESHLPSSELTDVVYKDARKAQKFVEGAGEIDGTKLDVFKDYLRDLALRYSQASDEL
jgi:hypothetical protein